jgi:dTDP-4-dehydrorhamnose reductase
MAAPWLVTGGRGMLGQAVAAVLADRGIPATIAGHAQLDITDAGAVVDAVAHHQGVINTAAWAGVDAAETNPAAAAAVNDDAVGGLAATCEFTGTPLIHVSTDYVFNGDATVPYPEDTPPDPVNAYGRSKADGESQVLLVAPSMGWVVRTAWLYDTTGRNFVTTMLRLAGERDTIGVVDDQWGQPTWTAVLAERLADLAAATTTGQVPPGIYHAAAAGSTTWFGFARALFAEAGLDPQRIKPITTGDYPLPATRPAYSVLSLRRWVAAGLQPLGHWRPMLTTAMQTTKNGEGLG